MKKKFPEKKFFT